MQKIIVCGGNAQDKKQAVLLLQVLSERLSQKILFCDETAVISSDQEELFFLYRKNITFLQGKQILLLLKKANLRKLQTLSEETIVIIDSANQRQLEEIAKFHVNVITVGLSPKDTITFSSKDEDSFVISLQREITSLFDKSIEPLEIPCNGFPVENTFLLQAAAIFLLTGLFDPNQDTTLSFPSGSSPINF